VAARRADLSGELSCGKRIKSIDGDCLTTLHGGGRSLHFRAALVPSYQVPTKMQKLGTPTSFALAIVFNYVRERLDDDRSEYVNDRLSETTGTPWENDQDHTTAK